MDRRVRLPAARGGGSGGTTAAPLPEHYRHRLPQGVGGARRLFWPGAQRPQHRFDGVDAYYGRQVALIGFGDVPEAELTEPPLTFVSSSAREVGRSAAARLLQRIGDADLPAQNVILPPTLIRRGSA